MYDFLIIGAGLVGLACAYQLNKKFPNAKIIILEKENAVAMHQSGRNSGVIHSGIYYPAGSYKSNLSIIGKELLINFAKQNQIPHRICGKLIVATHELELPYLQKIFDNGQKNNVGNIKFIDKQDIAKFEPNCTGIAAIWVQDTGVIDFNSVANCLKIYLQNKKINVITNCKVVQAQTNAHLTTLKCSNLTTYNANFVINCSGLHADKIALMFDLKLNHKILGFRGDYYQLKPSKTNLVKGLIYPVPNPLFPFLGVHFTRTINNDVECGPNAVLSFKREGYGKYDFNLKNTIDTFKFCGTWHLLKKHWKHGLNEYKRAFSKYQFLQSLQTLIPCVQINDIEPARSGVRAVLVDKYGTIENDFVFKKHTHSLHVLQAPSPAATACFAVGNEIIKQIC